MWGHLLRIFECRRPDGGLPQHLRYVFVSLALAKHRARAPLLLEAAAQRPGKLAKTLGLTN